MNRKLFLKLVTFGMAYGCIKLTLNCETDIDKKITIYGYDWEYDSFNYRYRRNNIEDIIKEGKCYYFASECNLYPNKKNRKEYIYLPPKNRGGFIYNYEKGIKTIYTPAQINGMIYVKNKKTFKIKKEFSTHIGFCDKVCNKIEFII